MSWIHFKYSLKRQEASNRLREDIAPGNSGDKALRSNCWTYRGTLLQSILDNWAVSQELWDDILEGKVDSYLLKRKSKVLISFFEYNWELFWCIQTTYVLLYNTHTSCYKGQKNCKSMFFNITRYERGS